MAKKTAAKDLYLTADRSRVVAAGDDAAFLLARAGRDVDPAYADLVTTGGNPKKASGGNKEQRSGEDK